jgi:hypothetical protein
LGTLSKLDPDQAGRLTKQLAVLLSDALMRADGKQKIIIAVAIGEVAAGLDEESAAKRASAILPLVDQADETERWKLCHAIPNVIDRAGAKRNELLRLHALQLLSFLENASDISRMGNISWYLYEVVNKLGPTDKLSLVPRIVALNDRPTSERAVGLRMSLQQGTQFLNQEAGLRFVDDYFGAAERRNEGYLWFDLIGAKDMPAALSDKALVKLLASPTCVGNYRQFILARLETRLAKTFNDDRWNFVAAWINERGEQVVKPRRASY